MNSNSSRSKTFEQGFIGVLNRISLVRSLNAAASSSRGSRQVGGSSRTSLGVPPARRTIGKYKS